MPVPPAVGVVVPTRGRAPRLDRLLGVLADEVADVPAEVVVVVDGPDPASVAVVERRATDLPVRCLVRDRSGGPGPARNTGWRDLDADVVAFVDDDCVPRPGWLAAVTGPVLAGDADVVQGRTVVADGPHRADGWDRQVAVPDDSGRFETCNIAYRRRVLARADGFDEAFTRAGEDVDLGRRALALGARFTFEARAVVAHDRVREDLGQMLRSRARALDLARMVARHPALRDELYLRAFWDRRHALTLGAIGAVGLAAAGRRPALAGLLAAGWLGRQARRFPDATPPRRVALAAGAALADAWEVACTLRGAVRARTLLL